MAAWSAPAQLGDEGFMVFFFFKIDLGRPYNWRTHIKDWHRKKFEPLAQATRPHDIYSIMVNKIYWALGFESYMDMDIQTD